MNEVLNSQSYMQAAWLNRIVLPLIISTSFLLIADFVSPRRGIIRIHPLNLLALSQFMNAQ